MISNISSNLRSSRQIFCRDDNDFLNICGSSFKISNLLKLNLLGGEFGGDGEDWIERLSNCGHGYNIVGCSI